MKLIVGALVIAVVIGYLMGGRLSNLAHLRIRWAPLAIIGLVMQVINPPGHWPLAMLIGSFVLLLTFAIVNQGIYYTGWNSDWASFILGVLILAAVLMNNTFRRFALAQAPRARKEARP